MNRILFVWLYLFPLFGYGQTGPGGVGNSTNNVLWLSGDSGVFIDLGTNSASSGDDVRQWNDRSGNDNNALQNTFSFRPTYETGVFNGLPVIRFNAANGDRMLSSGIATGNAASVWVVVQFFSLPGNNPGILQGAPNGFPFSNNMSDKVLGLWVSTTNSQVWGRGVQSNFTIRNVSQTTTLSSNTPYILNSLYDGINSINQYVNNATAGNVSYDGTLADWSDFGIGAQGSESWNGDIAEVIVYNSFINSAQKLIIDNYLGAKYNIALGTNDLFNEGNASSGFYYFDVAGIGKVNPTNDHLNAQSAGMVRILNPSWSGNNNFYLWGHNGGVARATNTTDIPNDLQARLERVWKGTETGTVSSFDVRFDLTGLGPVNPSDLRLLIDTDSDGTFSNETTNSGGIIADATYVGGNEYEFASVTNLNNNIRFTLGTVNATNTPLPVELLKFDVTPDAGKVKLEWVTASENDNDYFTIERSQDGKDWIELKKVPGAGNYNKTLYYLEWDHQPYAGLAYYRLKQTDFNGISTSSNIKSVNYKGEYGVNTYPNPAKNELTIELNNIENSKITLINFIGQIIPLSAITTSNKVILNTSNLKKGIYFIRIQINNKVENKKIIIN